jgi:hypothetical protein
VYARTTLIDLPFDAASQRKIFAYAAKGDAAQRINDFVKENAKDSYLTVPKKYRGDVTRTKLVVGESDITVAARLKYEAATSSVIEFLRFGKTFTGFDVKLEDNKLVVRFVSTLGLADKEAEGSIAFDAPPAGEWFQLIASVDRVKQQMTVNLNGEKQTTRFAIQPGQSIAIDRLRIGYNRNQSDVMCDHLTIFDYVLSESEERFIRSGDIIKQSFPQNGDKAHPKGVNMAWTYSGRRTDPEFIVVYATDAQFKDRHYVQTKETSTVLSNLKKNTRYFWRVGLIHNGKKHFPWKSYNTFLTDDSIQDAELKLYPNRKLRVATARDNNYSENLGKIAVALYPPDSNGKRKSAAVYFAKMEGDSWLRCHSDGTLTTNFGAPKPGSYKFKFSVSTRDGIPEPFETTITVK